jgi:predicted DNA-binding transcriptional regulator YafY
MAAHDRLEKGHRILRLINLLRMFQAAPEGLSTRQVAERLGVSQRSVQRDINALGYELHVPFHSSDGRWVVGHQYWLRPIAFSLQEAIGLLLSARLMLRHADKADAQTAAAYEKLAAVLPSPLRQPLANAAFGLSAKPVNPTYSRVFGALAIAWADQRQVDIRYQTAPDKMRRVWPLFLEPGVLGHSCYLLAWDQAAQAPRVFKVERILDARMRSERFEAPKGFSIDEQLKSAWGIWGSTDPIEAELIFKPDVVARVRETIWHPSQVLEELPEGGLRMTLRIGHWLEIRHWVLGWGASCEVIRPAELRRAITEAVGEMARNYGLLAAEEFRRLVAEHEQLVRGVRTQRATRRRRAG